MRKLLRKENATREASEAKSARWELAASSSTQPTLSELKSKIRSNAEVQTRANGQTTGSLFA